MKLFKNYKKLYNDTVELYNNELENRKLLIKQNSELSKRRIDSDIENKKLREENAQLKIVNEDLNGFYFQEKEAKEELLKQRKQLRKMITQLGGNWKNEKK